MADKSVGRGIDIESGSMNERATFLRMGRPALLSFSSILGYNTDRIGWQSEIEESD